MNTVDIIVPCYNPPDGWHINVANSIASLHQLSHNKQYALILINDGSEQSIENEVKYLGQQPFDLTFLSTSNNRGKGHALKKGLEKSTADYALYTDIDFPYSISSMKAIVQCLQNTQGDIIVGVRESGYYEAIPSQRSTISRILKWLNRKLLRLDVNDTQAGLKGLSKKGKTIAQKVKSDRYLFDLELIKRGSKNDQIKVIPCVVSLRTGIEMSRINVAVMLRESLDFVRILFV